MQITSQPSMIRPASALPATRVNWPHVAWFLGLTFGLTWLVDLFLYWQGGLSNPIAGLMLQFQMLMPAFCAMLLGTFFFHESPIYYRSRGAARWFIYFYFLLTFLYLTGLVVAVILPEQLMTVSTLLLIPTLIGLILLVVLRVRGGKEDFAGAGLAGGKWYIWLLYGLGLVVFYGLTALLNYVLKLGEVVDLTAASSQMAAANLPASAFIPITAINMLIVGPFLGLIVSFGEEYGWRGYLQTELTRLGRIRGVFLLGIIWGIWHWPVIWMGHNFPGEPVLGSVAMVLWCIFLAYIFAYGVFKSNGIWTAAYLHAINNQALAFFMVTLVMPTSMLWSFGTGFPTIVLGAIIVLLILRDPVWKITGKSHA